MTHEQNEALVRAFYKAFDDRKIDQAMDLLSADCVAHLAGVPQPLDKEGFKQFGMPFYLAFSQGQHIFEEAIVTDHQVVTCGTFTATHLGEFQGLPPTGKKISFSIMHIDRIQDGKIVEHWGQGDALGLMQQLGIIFLPSPKLLPHILKGATSKLLRKRR
jgi:steroid delta-isomerase-like uncharacterized protein